MDPTRSYDAVHVISDLHLGGETKGRQIFDLGRDLARTIDHLAAESKGKSAVLVINGDLVDFLAEPKAKYFDPEGAIEKLDRIAQDESFAPVFQALTRFVQQPSRNLAITLGNHDIELALPWVRDRLLDILSGGKDEARGRILTAFDGTGFMCLVAGRKVLCIHGNDVDPWNVTDYATLQGITRDIAIRGTGANGWIPNGGTQLVIDVMNDIKKEFPFVDLLKPETKAVPRVLLALDKSAAKRIGGAIPPALRRLKDRVRIAFGLLSDGNGVAAAQPELEALEDYLLDHSSSAKSNAKSNGAAANRLWEAVEARLAAGEDAVEQPVAGEGALGDKRAALMAIGRKDTKEVLRESLEILKNDSSFAIDKPDETFEALDAQVDPDVDFIVAGHTHLERAIRRRASRAYYNSGTWVRIIRLDDKTLDSPTVFAGVYAALEQRTMAALDEAKNLVQRRPAVVSIWRDGDGAKAELRRVTPSGKTLFDTVAGSRYPEELRNA